MHAMRASGKLREQASRWILRHQNLERSWSYVDGRGWMALRSMAQWITIDLDGDRMVRAYLDLRAFFVLHPLTALLTVQQEIEKEQGTTQHVLSPHNTDIEQAIIALCQPGILDRTTVELRIADDYL